MNGSSILTAQEEERSLRLLAAQRRLYRLAKRCMVVQMVLLIVVPGILATWAWYDPHVRPWAAMAGLAILILDVLLLDPTVRAKRQQGATAQEEFDVSLFGLEWPSWRLASRLEPELIRDASADILASDEERAKLNGWYPAAIARLPDLRAVLVCQRFNIMYGLRIRRLVVLALLIVILALGLGFLVIMLWGSVSMANALLAIAVPALPLVSWIWREYFRQRDHVTTQERIKGSIEKAATDVGAGTLSEPATAHRVRHLQGEILAARIADPLIFDWIYNRLRRKNEKTMAAAAEDYVDELLRVSPSKCSLTPFSFPTVR